MVSFDSQGKITAIRQSWDQGSLLKQLDVIGKSGRNWPIRDSKEQIRLITSSLNAAGVDAAQPANPANSNRSRTNTNNALRDPHASLALFAPRDAADIQPEQVISPYAGTRPRQRTFTELFGDEPVEEPGSPSNGRDRSPNKAIAPKAGVAKNVQPIRLFDTAEEDVEVPENTGNKSPEKFYRPNPKKFSHFDFADGSDPQDAPRPAPPQQTKSKKDSSWSFEDFATPAKAVPTRSTHRSQDVRHWSNDNEDSAETPARKPTQAKGRRDAEHHFDFVDDGEPGNEPRIGGRPRGTAQNTGLGLYDNNLYNEDGSKPTPGAEARALGNITNLEDRRKDFAPHFEMTDDSPAHGNGIGKPQGKQDDFGKAAEHHKQAVKMMESNWDTYDTSPAAQKENSNPHRNGIKKETGITIAGDGMGGRKGAGRNYLTGSENAIGTAGDGMGGKKGSGRGWAIGDESDEELGSRRASGPGKRQVVQKSSNFWDY